MSNNTELAHRDKRHSRLSQRKSVSYKEGNEGEKEGDRMRGEGRCPQCWSHSAVVLINSQYSQAENKAHMGAHTHTHTDAVCE